MAAVVIVGWHAHIPAAVQVFSGLIPMQYNTALCFLALGAAGLAAPAGKAAVLAAGGASILFMGAAVLLSTPPASRSGSTRCSSIRGNGRFRPIRGACRC